MKFSVQVSDFQKILQRVIPVIPPRAAFDAIEQVFISLVENELTIVGSDIEITIKTNITVNGMENGQVLVPAKKLDGVMKALPQAKEMVFESEDENFEVRISSGTADLHLKGMDPDDYIQLPDLFDKNVPTAQDDDVAFFKKEVILKLAEKTYFAVSQEDYRLNMSGVLFQFRESFVNAVATDSFRLVRATSFATDKNFPKDVDILIPVRAIELCRKIDSDMTMMLDASEGKARHLRMDFGSTTIVTRLLNESFPKYEAIIPLTSNCQATFDISELLSAIKVVSTMASDDKTKKCRLEFSEKELQIIVESEFSSDKGVDKIPCELLEMDSFSIVFNIKFFIEMIQNITPNDTTDNLVTMFFITPDKAALIKPKAEEEALVMILMPIRMN